MAATRARNAGGGAAEDLKRAKANIERHALKAKSKLVLDDVEKEIVKKYRDIGIPDINKIKKDMAEAKNKGNFADIFGDQYADEGYKGDFIKKRALVDQQLLINANSNSSYAQRKWRWIGDQGAFES